MAAGSTDSFSAAPQTLVCFNTDILQNAQDKFWSSGVVATASTGAFWEDEPEEKVKKLINALKRKFHGGRQLLIKYLPRDVSEEDLRELLADFPLHSVLLQNGAGSGSARVALEDPEMLEDWDRERVFMLRGQRIPVAPAPTEMMLCVARLPPAFSEPQFAALVRSYGEVRRSFLMLSERSGASKGYGFVEYTLKETAMQAKSLLDGRQLDGFTLCCDWLDASHVTFESLHSKCLYVDRLPPNFRDMGEFRKVFSSIVNPPYCQIALRNGCPQDWGLVEFSTAEDAEVTRTAVEKVQLRGHLIRVAFYIPGVRAINLYLKLLNDSQGNKTKGALLPDPPAPAVFQQLQNLAKQNPIFAQNLQNIIISQIQTLPPKNEAKSSCGSSSSCSSSSASSTCSNSSSSATSISIPPPRKAAPAAMPGKPSPTGTNGNTQAALVVLLAAQMQMQMGNNPPSLLGNPQMLATLQNLIKQQSGAPPSYPPPQFQQQQAQQQNAAAAAASAENMQANKNGMNGLNGINGIKNGYHKPINHSKVPLLPSPSSGVSPPPREVSPLESHLAAAAATVQNDAATAAAVSNFWNGLLSSQMHGAPSLSPQALEQLLAPKPQLQEKIVYSNKPVEMYTGPHSPAELQHSLGMILSNAHNLNALLGTLVPPGFAAAQQQQRQAPPVSEAAWGLPPSPPPPPAAWVPPMGSPLRPWAGSQYQSSATPIVFAGHPGLWAASQPPQTPVGQKRKYNHILPSPEPSPEGNYIGQHSQGLGGHYADSYFKRKKKH